MAQKKYLDLNGLQHFYNKIESNFLPVDGGTVTGNLKVNSDLTVNGNLYAEGSVYGSYYQIDTTGTFHTKGVINFNQSENTGGTIHLLRYTYNGSHPIISVDAEYNETTIGDEGNTLFFEGSAERPTYNGEELVLNSDMVVLTQTEYDQLPTKDANVLYFIKEGA